MSEQYPGGFINKTAPTLNPALGNAAPGIWNMTQVQQAVKSSTWPGYDPYYKNVVLNLHGNGTNGAQNNTFLDSSTNNATITRNGNTTQGTFSPYATSGYWSNYFDGSGDYLTIGSSGGTAIGTSDFTIEFWIYMTNSSVTQVDYRPSSTNGAYPAIGLIAGPPGTASSDYYVNSVSRITSSTGPTLNAWSHIAVSRVSGSTRFFIDGVQVGSTWADSTTYVASNGNIWWNAFLGARPGTGYVSNYRLVLSGLYSANFTPPTAPLTAISGTQALLCQSNRFIDISTNAYALTITGDVSVQRLSPFTPTVAYSSSVIGGSGYFDGNGDYLRAPTGYLPSIGTGNFTVEGWWRFGDFTTRTSYFQRLWSFGTGLANDVTLNVDNSGNLVFRINDSTIASQSSGAMKLNSWNHVALVRSGSTVTIYLNGASVASASNSSNLTTQSTNPFYIGSESDGAGGYFYGYCVDVRVNNTAVYTTTFTPPTAPLTAISGTGLLLNMTNAGILDNAMMNDLETVGNAQISTSVYKYGTGSMSFDGTDDRLVAPASPNIAFGTGDFTVEAWIYPNVLTGERGFIQTSDTAGGLKTSYTTGIVMLINVSPYPLTANVGGTNVTSSVNISASTWTHVALTRSSGSVRLFVNGALVGGPTTITADLTGQYLCVGGYYSTTYLWNGYIDDLRITKGYARYTAAFTAPTSQLQDQ